MYISCEKIIIAAQFIQIYPAGAVVFLVLSRFVPMYKNMFR